MTGIKLLKESNEFRNTIDKAKADIDPKFPWYPYGILNNFIHLQRIFDKHPLDTLVGNNGRTLDIGAADGDLAFFLESKGFGVDVVDFPPTNFNNLKGARLIKEHRKSAVGIYEVDLDTQFTPLTEKYGLVFFLGILYHLKNPYYILETLSRSTQYLIVSTRIAKKTKTGMDISGQSLAYLLRPDETNNDATNFWIFSWTGLERIFQRTGWDIIQMYSVGDVKNSNPSDPEHDERAFALLRSRNF